VLLALSFFNDYVTVPEILWTVLGLVGMVICLMNLRSARSSAKRYIALGQNGLGLMLAGARVRREAMRSVMAGVTVGIGVSAMLTPPANPDVPVSTLALLITGGLFLINLIIVIDSTLDSILNARAERG
jgi:hypothetical protein